MSQLILNRGNTYRGAALAKLFRRFSLGPYFLLLSLIFFVALITVVTLIYSTSQVTKGNVLSSLTDVKEDLVKDSEILDMKISEIKSMIRIEQNMRVRRMVRPNMVVFMAGENEIAKR